MDVEKELADPSSDLNTFILSDSVTENTQASEVESDSITDVTGLSKSENISFIESEMEIIQESSSQRTNKNGYRQENKLTDWYNQKCFQRYWEHYHFAMSWCKKHFDAYKYMCNNCGQSYWENINGQFTSLHVQKNSSYAHQQNSDRTQIHRVKDIFQSHQQNTDRTQIHRVKDIFQSHTTAENDNSSGSSNSRKRSRKRNQRSRKKKMLSEQGKCTPKEGLTDEMSVEETEEIVRDGESFKMEITDDMLDFFLKSQKHKQERDAEKEVHSQQTHGQNLVNVESVKLDQKNPTVEAPKERPGLRRTAEMKMLYGKNAAMIHGMETALQMTFDRNMDIKQPKLWPNMPLCLAFN